MPHDPKHLLSETEKHVFGPDSYRDEITGEPVEISSGALPVEQQRALVHVLEIERREGKEAADAVRRKISMATRPFANNKKD
jgi:hypothetical protein